jgi:hypothetical protein
MKYRAFNLNDDHEYLDAGEHVSIKKNTHLYASAVCNPTKSTRDYVIKENGDMNFKDYSTFINFSKGFYNYYQQDNIDPELRKKFYQQVILEGGTFDIEDLHEFDDVVLSLEDQTQFSYYTLGGVLPPYLANYPYGTLDDNNDGTHDDLQEGKNINFKYNIDYLNYIENVNEFIIYKKPIYKFPITINVEPDNICK